MLKAAASRALRGLYGRLLAPPAEKIALPDYGLPPREGGIRPR